jgi:hypothetical protein
LAQRFLATANGDIAPEKRTDLHGQTAVAVIQIFVSACRATHF